MQRSNNISMGNSACRRWMMPTHVEFWNWGTHNLTSGWGTCLWFILFHSAPGAEQELGKANKDSFVVVYGQLTFSAML
jgi:hypothetical protein